MAGVLLCEELETGMSVEGFWRHDVSQWDYGNRDGLMSRWTGGVTDGVLILLARRVEGSSVDLCPCICPSIYLRVGLGWVSEYCNSVSVGSYMVYGLWFDLHLHVTCIHHVLSLSFYVMLSPHSVEVLH